MHRDRKHYNVFYTHIQRKASAIFLWSIPHAIVSCVKSDIGMGTAVIPR